MSEIGIFVRLEAVPEHWDAFTARVLQHARNSLADPGCLRFDVHLPREGDNTLLLYELYQDQEAFDRHVNADFMAAFRADTKDMVASRELTICDRVSADT